MPTQKKTQDVPKQMTHENEMQVMMGTVNGDTLLDPELARQSSDAAPKLLQPEAGIIKSKESPLAPQPVHALPKQTTHVHAQECRR